MSHKKILELVLNKPGYTTNLQLNNTELASFKDAIFNQYLQNIKITYPNLYKNFKENGLENYHLLSKLINHEIMWLKINRCLPQDFVNDFKKMEIYIYLKEIFGPFRISGIISGDKVYPEREEIYWRLVRPCTPSDIGPLHADKWFHEIDPLHEKILGKNTYTIKIWIPIITEPGKNGLLLVPNSNLKKWKYDVIQRNNNIKPKLIDDANPILVSSKPGNLIIFNENLLHGGAVNEGKTTRVSCEITMVFDKKLNLFDS